MGFSSSSVVYTALKSFDFSYEDDELDFFVAEVETLRRIAMRFSISSAVYTALKSFDFSYKTFRSNSYSFITIFGKNFVLTKGDICGFDTYLQTDIE